MKFTIAGTYPDHPSPAHPLPELSTDSSQPTSMCASNPEALTPKVDCSVSQAPPSKPICPKCGRVSAATAAAAHRAGLQQLNSQSFKRLVLKPKPAHQLKAVTAIVDVR